MQAMFIDVDGTLSSPCYKVNGKFQIGMSDVQWADYCSKHGEDTYEWCRPVMQVKEYAMKAKEKGTKLYVLTTSGTKIETAAKRRFLDRYYAGMFDDIYAVEHDDDKVRFILKKAAEIICIDKLHTPASLYANITPITPDKNAEITEIFACDLKSMLIVRIAC